MLPFPHLLFFMPISVLALLCVITVAVNGLASYAPYAPGALRPKPAASRPAAPGPAASPSAEIIYFRPRKSQLRSTLDTGVRQPAMRH